MLNTDKLISHVAYDIISVITIWGLLNNSNIYENNLIDTIYYSIYKNFIGIGFSMYTLRRYM